MRTLLSGILLLGWWSGLAAQQSHPKSASAQHFQQDLARLQQNPTDRALREELIQAAQEMNPQPEIPKEARGHFSKGYFAQREAKSSKDFDTAVAEYQKAIDLAPWWAAAYYHLGTAYESLNKPEPAIENLKLFLASHPGHAGEQEAVDHIRKLQAQNTGKK